METVTIISVEDFISKITFFEETDAFRGVSDERYKLIPSLGRVPFEDPDTYIYQYEESVFEDFKRKSVLLLKNPPETEFEWLILAQHYGLPTRLLDWTYNPLIALFFAIENEKETDGCIYQAMFNRLLTTKALKNENPFKIKEPLGIIPSLNNERLNFQNGIFTINPEPHKENLTFIFRKYVIPKDRKKSMRWKLRKLGITKTLIFPQLDSLAYDIVKIHKSKYEHAFKKSNKK